MCSAILYKFYFPRVWNNLSNYKKEKGLLNQTGSHLKIAGSLSAFMFEINNPITFVVFKLEYNLSACYYINISLYQYFIFINDELN